MINVESSLYNIIKVVLTKRINIIEIACKSREEIGLDGKVTFFFVYNFALSTSQLCLHNVVSHLTEVGFEGR
jgi:hypothetical protein